MAKRKKSRSSGGKFFLVLLILLLLAALGYGVYLLITRAEPFWESEKQAEVVVRGDVAVHFLELGNHYTGDCTYIKANGNDILIDAGSTVGSIPTITSYINRYVTDGKLEYVIVTHAHKDHYAGFATGTTTKSIFDLYECGTIIDFALTNQTASSAMYGNYQRELADEIAAGATHYTAAECRQNGNYTFSLGEGITMEILDSYYYYNKSSSENDYSVCMLLTQGNNSFLFTGDLEEKGEKKLVEMNDLPDVTLFKGGHHGSPTSSCTTLLNVIKPDIVAVCCCAGSDEYTKTATNQFPSQAFIDRVAPYTDRVYITSICTDNETHAFTSFNGNITVTSGEGGAVTVSCSANDTKLKDSAWFRENRTCPAAWK